MRASLARRSLLAVALQRAHDELDRDARAVLVDDRRLVAHLAPLAHDLLHLVPLVVGDEGQHVAADHLLQRVADQLAARRVDVGGDAVLVEQDALDRRLHELVQPRLGLAHRALGQAVLGDVVDQHAARDRLAVLAQLRDEVHLDPARRAVGRGQLALVGHGHALRQHLVHGGLDARLGLRADDLAEGLAEDALLRQPEGLGIAAVGEQADLGLGIVEGDPGRQVVRQQLEARSLDRPRRVGSQVHVLEVRRARHRSSQAPALSAGERSK
jgi:hypothetical protein